MRTHVAGILAGLLVASGAAFAQQPAPAFATPNLSEKGVAALAANCAACHGTRGTAAPGSAVAGLAGKPAEEIVQSMAQFKAGTKPATVMHQIAKGYGEGEIAAVAAYFAKQKR